MSNSVPAGWTSSRLCDLADIRSSNVDKKSNDDEIPVRLCNYTDVYYNNEITNKISFMAATAKQSQIDRFSLECGDVIITKDSETPDDIAIPTYVAEPLSKVLCGYHLSLIRPDKLKANGRFLSHLFGLPKVRHHFYILANGITRYGLNIDAIENAPIQTPPLPEQQKIAAILTAVDEVIASTQAQISKLKDLKTGMMQELLTKGIGHTEFKDSPVGRIPAKWQVVTFNEIFKEYKYGPRFSSKDYDVNGNVKTIRGTDVSTSGNIHYQQVPTAKINQGTVDSHALKEGDLVMITTAECGLTAVFHEQDIPYIASAYAIKLTPTDMIDSQFVMYFMQTSNAMIQVESFIRKGTVANLPGSDVMTLLIALPPINEQRKIISTLSSLDNQISLKHKEVQTSGKLKKALMQDLLTGKVRVRVN